MYLHMWMYLYIQICIYKLYIYEKIKNTSVCVYLQLRTVTLLRPKGVEGCEESHSCRTCTVIQYVKKKLEKLSPLYSCVIWHSSISSVLMC